MSVNVAWQPAVTDWHHTTGGLSVVSALREAFGDGREWVLSLAQLDTLSGMYAASKNEAYRELIRAVEAHGIIRIRAEY